MKRFLTLIAATAALGLAGLAYAGGPEDQTGAQPSPAEQRSMPSTDPTTPYATDPSAMAQSSVSSLQSTRLAAIGGPVWGARGAPHRPRAGLRRRAAAQA